MQGVYRVELVELYFDNILKPAIIYFGGGGREERGWSGVGGFWGVTWSFMGNGAGSVVANGVEEHYWKLTAS